MVEDGGFVDGDYMGDAVAGVNDYSAAKTLKESVLSGDFWLGS